MILFYIKENLAGLGNEVKIVKFFELMWETSMKFSNFTVK